jgi:hypothetical protein
MVPPASRIAAMGGSADACSLRDVGHDWSSPFIVTRIYALEPENAGVPVFSFSSRKPPNHEES